MESLVRLVYRSLATEPVGYKGLTQILRASRRNNRGSGITGLLLADERGFLQVLEGESSAVNRLFQRVSRDNRHTEVCLIGYEKAANRSFAKWNMRGVGLFSFRDGLRAELIGKYSLRQSTVPFDLELEQALALLHEVARTVAEEQAVDSSGDS